jgi:arylformamidase
MSDPIYRGYTREQLDAQYTNLTSDAAKAAAAAMQDQAKRNLETLKPQRGLSYGPGPERVFDLYRADKGAPALIFLSGGQWQRGGPGLFSSWSDACVGRGIAFVDGGFPQIPAARLPEIVDSVVMLIRDVRARAGELGIDGARIAVSGHSSGAHLAAMAMVRLANADDLDGIAGVYLLSGHYDLRPAMRNYRAEYLQLSVSETIAHSPILNFVQPLPPTMVAVGGEETDEMVRQSREFHASLTTVGPAELRVVSGTNHFDVAGDLGTPGTPSWDFLGRVLGLAQADAAQ